MKPDPDEFRRFIELLQKDAPDNYTPWLFRCDSESKAPDTSFGSWKNERARLTVDQAIEWLERGGNVGIAGRGTCPNWDSDEDEENHHCHRCEGDPEATADRLINVDIDDEDETSIDDLKSTLIARSRSRTGVHGWYFEADETSISNITTDTAGEVRTEWQYVVAPGSYVPVDDVDALPEEQQDKAGYYTVERADPVTSLEYDELPDVFRQEDNDPADVSLDDGAFCDTGQQQADNISIADSQLDSENRDSDSALFDITARDVVIKENGSTNASDRWSGIFHGSKTGGNMQYGGQGLLHCYRHNCSHNGLQALATLSDYNGSCKEVGSGHRDSDTGLSCLRREEGAHIFHAWAYAKRNGYIPDGDPVPYVAMKYVCLSRDLCTVSQLPTAEDETIPNEAWNAAISSIKNHDELNPGRRKQTEFDDGETAEPATDGGSATTTADPAAHPETTEDPSEPDTSDTAALTPRNLKIEAGIGEDESLGELSDREKAAFIWELIKRNESRHIRLFKNDSLIAYSPATGTWNGDGAGERELKQAARRALPPGEYGTNVFEQLKSQVEADPAVTINRDEMGLPAGKIAVQNGLLDLREAYENDGKAGLRDLQPTDYAVNRLQATYDPGADGTEWNEFVTDTVETDMIQSVQEYLGTCLYNGHQTEKALLLVGSGENGKSTFLDAIRTTLGDKNISTVTPGDFNSKNSIAEMENKKANIAAEISGQTLQGASLNKFKTLTGGDPTEAERKYQSPFTLDYTGGMIFATNEVPAANHVSDGDRAFWRRWLIAQFDNVFPEGSDKRDPELRDRLQEERNLSAILNWMIDGFGRFEDNGQDFSHSLSPAETRSIWENWGDSLDYFLKNVADRDEEAPNISTGEAYQVYQQWCREHNESTVSQMKFTKAAKGKDLGYIGSDSSIRTRRSKSPTRGYTAFGTTDEMNDPVDVIEADTPAAGGLNSFDSADETDSDDTDDTDESDDTEVDDSDKSNDTDVTDSSEVDDTEANDSPTETDGRAEPAESRTSEGLRDKIKDAIRNDDSGDPVSLSQLRAVIANNRDDIIDAVSHLQSTNQVHDTGQGYVVIE